MKILVINAGSSSLKYQLFDMTDEQVLCKGLCDRIGIDGHIKHQPLTGGKAAFDEDVPLPDHAAAAALVMETLLSVEYGVIADVREIGAVGHRVVHGGEKFAASSLVTEAVLQSIRDCIPLAPIHNPAHVSGIEACCAVLGDTPQVVVFDSAFHQTIEPHVFTYALPYEYYEQHGLRRYSFHGMSYRYITDRAPAVLGRDLDGVKIVACHLGSGSTLCAIDSGKSVDTSMGFTPMPGVPMGTRSGDIDPGIIEFLCEREGLTVGQVTNILYKKSGVLGMSGLSSDFRDLGEAARAGNARAALALDVYCYSVSKFIGALAVGMGGIDALIFTGGIGENGVEQRAAICENLGVLGVEIDPEKNQIRGKEADVSAPSSRVRVLVIPTNEELVIARDTLRIVAG